ncbi:hypothetical protein QTP88_017394 [Uroleucon formosanum]
MKHAGSGEEEGKNYNSTTMSFQGTKITDYQEQVNFNHFELNRDISRIIN